MRLEMELGDAVRAIRSAAAASLPEGVPDMVKDTIGKRAAVEFLTGNQQVRDTSAGEVLDVVRGLLMDVQVADMVPAGLLPTNASAPQASGEDAHTKAAEVQVEGSKAGEAPAAATPTAIRPPQGDRRLPETERSPEHHTIEGEREAAWAELAEKGLITDERLKVLCPTGELRYAIISLRHRAMREGKHVTRKRFEGVTRLVTLDGREPEGGNGGPAPEPRVATRSQNGSYRKFWEELQARTSMTREEAAEVLGGHNYDGAVAYSQAMVRREGNGRKVIRDGRSVTIVQSQAGAAESPLAL